MFVVSGIHKGHLFYVPLVDSLASFKHKPSVEVAVHASKLELVLLTSASQRCFE